MLQLHFGEYKLCKLLRSWIKDKREEIESGWKDNATMVLNKEVATRSIIREKYQALNHKT
jgi:hypothetical protein